MSAAPAATPQICPACGGENQPDAVFCDHPPCHKALGNFKYVTEELIAEAKWHEALAERTTAFIGKPHFLLAHGVWFFIWIALNTGLVMGVTHFDAYPFSLLGIILAAEAIFITGFLLVTQNRQNAHASKRAELDYEVNVRTYREIARIEGKLDALIERLSGFEAP